MRWLVNWIIYIVWRVHIHIQVLWKLFLPNTYSVTLVILVLLILGSLGVAGITFGIEYLLFGKVSIFSGVLFLLLLSMYGAFCGWFEQKLKVYRTIKIPEFQKEKAEWEELKERRKKAEEEMKLKEKKRKLWL